MSKTIEAGIDSMLRPRKKNGPRTKNMLKIKMVKRNNYKTFRFIINKVIAWA